MKSFASMPGPKAYPLIGSLLQYSPFGPYTFDRLHQAKRENYQKYGKIYREKLGPAAWLVQVFDPEDAATVFRAEGRHPHRPPLPITLAAHKRDGLILGLGSLNGQEWYDLRSSVQRLMMHPKAPTTYLPAQNAVADDFLKYIEKCLDHNGEVTDFYQLILKYTMESIGTVCYNARLGCLEPNLLKDSIGHRMLAASSLMFDAVQKTMFSFPSYAFYRSALYQQFIEGKTTCDSIAMTFVQRAIETGSTQGCPVDASPVSLAPGSLAPGSLAPNFLSSLLSAEKLHPQRVVAITNELFTAGIDSTANALSFVIYNLARNPSKQQKLAEEIDSVLGPNSGGHVTADNIEKMSYMKACVKESFRLNFPVEGGTIRVLETDVILRGYRVPQKTIIVLNNQTMCLQSDYFDDAEQYIPERWLQRGSAQTKAPPRYVMLPFGHGPRMCIGRRFAEQEIYLALIQLMKAFRVEYHHEEVGMINRVFTVPDRPLRIHFVPRNR